MRVAGEPTAEFCRRRPAPALRPLIAWYIGYRETGGAPGRHRGLPSPYLTLIITLDDPVVIAAHPDPRAHPARYDTLLGGLHTAPAIITHDGRQSGVQVALSPLGARAVFGLPAGELAGTDLDLVDLLGPFAGELRERVRAAGGWAGRFAMLDELLTRLVDGRTAVPDEVTRAWHRLHATGGAVRIAALADEVGWSRRYLSRRFGVEVGLSPKEAGRVVRFDRARRHLQQRAAAGHRISLATVATTFGYYDQAHLTAEFGRLAGVPPNRWLAEEFRNFQAMGATGLPDSAP